MAQTEVKKPAWFECLRCGHEHEGTFHPRIIEERTCPRCASNSVRRLKGKPRKKSG